MPESKRPLKVFLCHASADKPVVRELSRRLVGEGWINTWLDEKSLLPGQDWRVKIEEAVEDSDIVIIFLSNHSVSKEGHVQKELRYAREIALEKPEEAIFIIPLRLDECEVPRGLRFYQWVDYFGENKEDSYKSLIASLSFRYEQKLKIEEVERILKEQLEREAAEKIALEKAEQEERQRIAKENTKREANERIERKKTEHALLKARREVAKKARQEKWNLLFNRLKPIFGVVVIIIVLVSGVTALVGELEPTPFGGGGSIVYNVNSEIGNEVYKFDIVSQQEIQLTSNDETNYKWGFSWAPDNQQIVFTLNFHPPNTSIMIMDSDGSNPRTILKNDCRNWFPDWSPDGKKILFSSDCPGPNHNIYTMSADGSSVTLLTDFVGSAPKWSPNGKLIAFQSDKDGSFDIYVMNSDGTNIKKLTNSTNNDMGPVWSPNGKQIAFSSGKSIETNQVYVMQADGSDQLNLSNNDFNETVYSWSPDSTQILFESDRQGKPETYLIDVKNGSVLQLPLNADLTSAMWSH